MSLDRNNAARNRYPTVAVSRDTVSSLFPAHYTHSVAEKNLTAAFVVISRRIAQLPRFARVL